MHQVDKEKTTFMTEHVNYQYNVTSFDLKNASETYQRMINNCFKDAIGETLEMYMDDMIKIQ